MDSITQDTQYKQSVIKYSLKHGVTKAAIRYKTNRKQITAPPKQQSTPTSINYLLTTPLIPNHLNHVAQQTIGT